MHGSYDTVIDLKVGGVILAEAVGISLILSRLGSDLVLKSVCVRDGFTNAYEEIAKGTDKPVEQAIWKLAEWQLEAKYADVEQAIAEAKQMEAA